MTEHAAGDWSKRVDVLLAENRPERYEQDDPWIAELAHDYADIVPAREARERALLQELKRRETAAKQQTKRVFRRIALDRQPPMDWLELRKDPVLIRKNGTTAQLHVLVIDDIYELARYEERRKRDEDRNYIAMMDGIDLVHDWLADQSVGTTLGNMWDQRFLGDGEDGS